MNARQLGSLLSIVVVLAACNTESGESGEEEELGTSSDAFTGIAAIVNVSDGPDQTIQMAVSPGTVPFLGGVVGNLTMFPENSVYVDTYIGVGNLFTLEVKPGGNTSNPNRLGGLAYAVYPAAYTPTLGKVTCAGPGGGNTTKTPIPHPSSGSYKCFLTEVRNTTAWAWNYWNDQAKIVYEIDGPKLACTNYAEATARCIPVTSSEDPVSIGHYSHWQTSTLGPVDWANGKVCLLYGIRGRFRTNSIDPTFNGVWVTHANSMWSVSTAAQTAADVMCVR